MQCTTAQGSALGTLGPKQFAPQRGAAGDRVQSIPNVALIIFNFVRVEQLSELVLIGHGPMMVLLFPQIADRVWPLRLAQRERAITVLPIGGEKGVRNLIR